MDARHLAEELNNLLSTIRCGLLAHLGEARPYLSAQTFRIWSDVQRTAHTTSLHTSRVSALLKNQNAPEHPGGFNPNVASYHYIDVQTLLPQLIQEKLQVITAFKHALASAAESHPYVWKELRSMLADQHADLLRLQDHQKSLSASAAMTGSDV